MNGNSIESDLNDHTDNLLSDNVNTSANNTNTNTNNNNNNMNNQIGTNLIGSAQLHNLVSSSFSVPNIPATTYSTSQVPQQFTSSTSNNRSDRSTPV